MQCVICKHGELDAGTTTVTLERDDVTLVFKDVPARVCENCGESYVARRRTSARSLQRAERQGRI